MFKLDLKKITLTAFRTPVQNGLMQKINIFYPEKEYLHAFYVPTKKSYKLDEGIKLIFVLKKSAITFGEGCMSPGHDEVTFCHVYNIRKVAKILIKDHDAGNSKIVSSYKFF